MATVLLYEKNGLKRGDPIGYAQFDQVLWDPKKQEYFVGILSGGGTGYLGNAFTVFLNAGTSGTIRIRFRGRESRSQIANFGNFEVWV